jgi:hypothetical protein
MGFNNPGRQSTLPNKNGASSANCYDDGAEITSTSTFDFNSSVSDALGACAMAVIAAGDMFSVTVDRGRNSVHVRVFSDEGNFDKWFNTSEALVKRLDKIYDAAVAKRNRKYPPTLETT